MCGAGERGGAETVLRTLLRNLDRRRVESSIVCLQDGPFVEECRGLAPVLVTPVGRFRNVWRARRATADLVGAIDATRAQVVHCHGTAAYLYGGQAARRCGVPVISHVHDVLATGWTPQRIVERAAFRRPPDAAVAVSRYVAGRLRESWRRRTRVIPNGVETAATPSLGRTSLKARLADRFGWPATCPLVVWCGRLQAWKGPHVFLEAAGLARRARPDARFLIVGGTRFGLEPEYARRLQRWHARLGLADAVRFVEWQDDATPFLGAADLVVHSSIRPEPFGLVIAEAQALETPVIAAAAGGPLELIVDGETGVLAPPGDASALARAIVELIDDPARRARLAAAGRARIATLFSAAGMARAVEALYDELVARAA